MWGGLGVKAVPFPVDLTVAGGGGGNNPQRHKAQQSRRIKVVRVAQRESPACQATHEVIRACNYKGLSSCLTGEFRVHGAPSGGKYLGTYRSAHEGAEARSVYTGAQLGDSDSNHNGTLLKYNEAAVQVEVVQLRTPPCPGEGRNKRLGYVAASKCAHCDSIWCARACAPSQSLGPRIHQTRAPHRRRRSADIAQSFRLSTGESGQTGQLVTSSASGEVRALGAPRACRMPHALSYPSNARGPPK
jgi:hypothetical protein